MSRTPEQRAADEALTAAIERAIIAYAQDTDEPAVLGPYAVVAGQAAYDDDGDLDSYVWHHTRDDNVPFYVERGLLMERVASLDAGTAQALADE